MKYICETFDSIDKMMHTITNRPWNSNFKSYSKDSIDDSESFTGTKNWDEAVELLKNGWEEPVKDLKEAVKLLSVKSNVTTTKTRPRNSVVGYAPCVPAAIQGLPESMIATERTPSKVKAVTIVYASHGSCATKTEQFLKSGAAVLKIINSLELKGYRVRLVNEFYGGYRGSETLVGRVVLKDWRQPIDLKKITFPMAHSSMLRRIGFRYIETTPGLTTTGWNRDYGTAIGNVNSYEEICKKYRDNGLLTDKEYYINMQMAEAKGYDSEAIMKAAGMNL